MNEYYAAFVYFGEYEKWARYIFKYIGIVIIFYWYEIISTSDRHKETIRNNFLILAHYIIVQKSFSIYIIQQQFLTDFRRILNI